MERARLARNLLPAPENPVAKPLSPRDQIFVAEYLRDFNGTQALIKAGAPARSAPQEAYKLLRNPDVMGAIQSELARRRHNAEVDAVDMASMHWDAANADIRKLTPFIIGSCRHCWGEDHEYQHTQGEQRARLRAHLIAWGAKKNKKADEEMPPLDPQGGTGYDRRADPARGPEWGDKANHDHTCPECNGLGLVVPLPPDLLSFTRGEALIYNGMEVRKDGSFRTLLNPRLPHMDRVSEINGLIRPRRAKWDLNFDEMPDELADAMVEEGLRRGLISQRDLPQTIDQTTDAEMVDVTPPEKVEP